MREGDSQLTDRSMSEMENLTSSCIVFNTGTCQGRGLLSSFFMYNCSPTRHSNSISKFADETAVMNLETDGNCLQAVGPITGAA